MSHRIVLASQKGGVGKTTISLNLAVALAEGGRRTLLVDLDPQGGVGLALAREDTEWAGLADRLVNDIPLSEAMVHTKQEALVILPRGRLSPEDTLAFEVALEDPAVLEDVVSEAEADFDFVILDTPSGLGRVTRSALGVAEFVLIPFQAEPLALRSVSQILHVMEHIRQNSNSGLTLLGMFPTMVELGKDTSMDVLREIWSGFSGVLDIAIPRTDAFAQASWEGRPLSYLGGKIRPEARRFNMLATEVEQRIRELAIERGEDDERPQRELV